MAITVACRCGRTFTLKDEAAGRRLKCPKCRQSVDIPATEPDLSPLTAIVTDPEDVAQLDPAGPDVIVPQSSAPAPVPTVPAWPPLTPFEKRLLAQLDEIGGITLSIRYYLAWIIILLLLQLTFSCSSDWRAANLSRSGNSGFVR